MRFSEIQDLSINRDRLYVPICDRYLPSHPKERYGYLDYWYYRSRFKMYGPALNDLPLRSLRRRPEHNESMWYRVSPKLGFEKFFPIGALLPVHEIFFNMRPKLEVVGEKRDPLEPWGFHYE